MSGLEIVHSGDMHIDYGTRRVLDTAGNFVVGAGNYGTVGIPQTINLSYPDFTKYRGYNWTWQSAYTGPGGSGSNYQLSNRADVWISAPPQEWSATTILAAAPPGTNFFFAKVRLNRTLAPTVTWNGQTMTVKPVQNKWISYTGSILVEAQINVSRSFSLYLDGGNLILHRQQSVGTPPGGWGQYGFVGTVPSGTTSKGGDWFAIDNTYGFTGSAFDGFLIYYDAATMSGTTTQNISVIVGSSPGQLQDRLPGGSGYVQPADVTDYSSVYSLDIAAKFCRAY